MVKLGVLMTAFLFAMPAFAESETSRADLEKITADASKVNCEPQITTNLRVTLKGSEKSAVAAVKAYQTKKAELEKKAKDFGAKDFEVSSENYSVDMRRDRESMDAEYRFNANLSYTIDDADMAPKLMDSLGGEAYSLSMNSTSKIPYQCRKR